jgi:hypothetical protein
VKRDPSHSPFHHLLNHSPTTSWKSFHHSLSDRDDRNERLPTSIPSTKAGRNACARTSKKTSRTEPKNVPQPLTFYCHRETGTNDEEPTNDRNEAKYEMSTKHILNQFPPFASGLLVVRFSYPSILGFVFLNRLSTRSRADRGHLAVTSGHLLFCTSISQYGFFHSDICLAILNLTRRIPPPHPFTLCLKSSTFQCRLHPLLYRLRAPF